MSDAYHYIRDNKSVVFSVDKKLTEHHKGYLDRIVVSKRTNEEINKWLSRVGYKSECHYEV